MTEATAKLSGWSLERSVVLARRLVKVTSARDSNAFWEKVDYEYDAYVTSLGSEEADAWQVVELYCGCGDTENAFDELKNHWGFSGFCCQSRVATEMAARLIRSYS